MINIDDKSKCSGCNACKSICPQKCIHMEYDNEGFYYPKIDISKCVNCKACERVCPYKNDLSGRSDNLSVYGCQINNEKIRRTSTSGGGFSAIAQYVLNNDGVVYGVGYDEKMHVVHKRVDSMEQLQEIRGSKYVQSEIGNTFIDIANLLKNDKYVLFSGTPCQVEGLLYYLKGINSDKLITIDIKCYGVPSPELFDIFQNYLAELYNSRIKEFYFRDKKYGYYGVNIRAILENGNTIEDRLELKTYNKTMFSKIGLRRSCYSCDFTKRQKLSDFTLGDIWNIDDYDPEMDDDLGTTCVEINTQKGEKIFNELIHNNILRSTFIANLTGEKLVNYQKSLQRHYVLDENKRKAFFDDMHRLPYENLMKKHFADNTKNKIDNVVKPLLNSIPGCSVIFKIIKKKKAGRIGYES